MKNSNQPQKDPLAGLEKGSPAYNAAKRAIADSKLSPLDRKSTKIEPPAASTKLPKKLLPKKGGNADRILKNTLAKNGMGQPAASKKPASADFGDLIDRIQANLDKNKKSPSKKSK